MEEDCPLFLELRILLNFAASEIFLDDFTPVFLIFLFERFDWNHLLNDPNELLVALTALDFALKKGCRRIWSIEGLNFGFYSRLSLKNSTLFRHFLIRSESCGWTFLISGLFS